MTWEWLESEKKGYVLAVACNAAAETQAGPWRAGELAALVPDDAYAPPAFAAGETGRDMIPLTAAEARRMFNLHTNAARPRGFHEYWPGWRRRRQAGARKPHYARRLRNHGMLS